jgi:hypothetical protein
MWQTLRSFFFAVVVAVLCASGAGEAVADDSPLFHLCLRGGNNPDEVRESKSACTTYLERLMNDVRFGNVAKPFCVPPGDLTKVYTTQQLNFLVSKIVADNPEILPHMREMIAVVVLTKSFRCSTSN